MNPSWVSVALALLAVAKEVLGYLKAKDASKADKIQELQKLQAAVKSIRAGEDKPTVG